jgi:hypothetical protein
MSSCGLLITLISLTGCLCCVRIKTNTYLPLHCICVVVMCRLSNIQVMGIGSVLAFYNTELNKLVKQKLRIEIMSLSYHPLCLADMSVHAIVVHRLLAYSVLPVEL